MSYSLTSIVSSQLSKKQIKTICVLKNQQWRQGIKSQISWYKKNIKRNDIHNLLYINNKLKGYTLLRKRTCNINKVKKESKYLLFDTIIIDKKCRGKKLSNLIMSFNNSIIEQSGYFSFLICNKKFVNFYKKFSWIKLKTNSIVLKDHQFSGHGMVYNKKNSKLTKNYFYTNR
jgi:hypothetical protein